LGTGRSGRPYGPPQRFRQRFAEEQLLDARGDSGVCAVLKVESGNCLKQLRLSSSTADCSRRPGRGLESDGKREVGIRAFPVEPCLSAVWAEAAMLATNRPANARTRKGIRAPQVSRRDLGHRRLPGVLGTRSIEGAGFSRFHFSPRWFSSDGCNRDGLCRFISFIPPSWHCLAPANWDSLLCLEPVISFPNDGSTGLIFVQGGLALMPATMQAVVKAQAAPGIEMHEVRFPLRSWRGAGAGGGGQRLRYRPAHL